MRSSKHEPGVTVKEYTITFKTFGVVVTTYLAVLP